MIEGHDIHPDDTLETVQTPILENMVVGVPPVFEGLTRQLDKLVEQPLLGPRTEFPSGECEVSVPPYRLEVNVR
jgi:hypothetical protein